MKSLLITLILALTSLGIAQPWQPQILWQREGAQDSSRYGAKVLALGDQNDDGFTDFGVFGYGSEGSSTDVPVLEFFHGGNPPESTPYLTLTSDSVMLEAAKTIGDLNGDGYVDWLLGYRLCGDIENCRQVRFHLGGPGGSSQPIIVRITGGFATYQPVGDFNGDGYDDVLFQDWWEDFAEIQFGSDSPDTVADWEHTSYMGVVWPGDLNGDGFSDLFTYVIDGIIEVYAGGTSPDTAPIFIWESDFFNYTAPISDLNNDGFDDVGRPRPALTHVYFGGPSIVDTSVDAQLDFACDQETGPYRVVSIGDINGDGYGDVAEWTYWCPDSWFGTLAIHLGGVTIDPQPVWTYDGWTEPYNVIGIEDIMGLGDVNGDEINDFAVGGYDDTPYLGWRGKAVVLSGIPLGANDPSFIPVPQALALSAYPNPFNSSTTIRINIPNGIRMGELTMYNVLGEVVAHREIQAHSTQLTVHLDELSGHSAPLSSGIYILAAHFGELVSSLKLVLIR